MIHVAVVAGYLNVVRNKKKAEGHFTRTKARNIGNLSHLHDTKTLISPYRLARGSLSLLAVSQSGSHTPVFQTFLYRILRY